MKRPSLCLKCLIFFQVHCLSLALAILKHERTRRMWITCKTYPFEFMKGGAWAAYLLGQYQRPLDSKMSTTMSPQ